MKTSTFALTALQFANVIDANFTPVGCRAVKSDTNWPAEAVWLQELPEAFVTRPRPGNASVTDFTYIARNASAVQAAVKFATKYNVRLTITNSGTDFLGRCVFAGHLYYAS
jgi:hypothetical protein